MRKTILYVGPKGACFELLGDFENIFFIDIDDVDAKNSLLRMLTDQSWLQKDVCPGRDSIVTYKKVKQNFIRDDSARNLWIR